MQNMERETNISTNRLYHYTDTSKKLIDILRNGFKPKYSLEKLGTIKKDELIDIIAKELNKKIEEENITDEFAIPMCCFCDIPLNLINEHVKVYGNYSIGLKKEWGERNAICPVFYVPKGGNTRYLFELIMLQTNRLLPQLQMKYERIQQIPVDRRNTENELLTFYLLKYLDSAINLIMYIKPYIGFYERKHFGYTNENYKFYDEREWRFIPNKKYLERQFLTKEEYENPTVLFEANKTLGNIDFKKEDIANIIVPEDEVIYIREELSKIERLKGIEMTKVNSIGKIIR